MKQTIYAPNMVPTANVAVNKSRLKVYKNTGSLPTYYLQKGQEFMIELVNPTTNVVLAKVTLNGKAISQGGLVLNPGQRVYLERYLDVAKKFLFDTYEVSGSDEMKAAIANNGDIKVEFYKERIPVFIPDYTYRPVITCGTYYAGTPNHILRSSIGTAGIGLTNTGGSYTTNGICGVSTNTSLVNASYTSNNACMDSLSGEINIEPKQSKLRLKRSLVKESIETGRVEKGSDSNQTFKIVDKDFDYYAFHTVEYKLLPVSQKVNTAEDINVKVYCTNCGSKLGKTDKFCSNCGTRK